VRERQREVRDHAGRYYSLRVRPYLTPDNKVDGAVLVLVDINDLKRHEQAIAAARDYAENIVETVREPLLVLDSELRVESANSSFYRTFGVAAATTVGKSIFEVGNREWDLPELRTLLADILPQKTTVEDFQVEHVSEQLGRRTMLLNARSLFDPLRDTQHILVAIEDITERKRAVEERARLAAIVEASDDAIVAKDLNGIITNWNRGAERLFGYTAKEAVGQPVTMLVPPERVDEEPFILERIRRGEAVNHNETVRRRKDGTRVDVSLTVSPIRNHLGHIIGASKIARDISEHKQQEQELQQAHEFAEAIVRSVRDPLLILSADLRVRAANEAFYSTFKVSKAETEGRLMFDLGNREWNVSRLPQLLADVLPRNSSFDGFEVTRNFERLGRRTMLVNARALQQHGEDAAILVGIQDVTELLQFQAEVRRSEIRYRRLFEASHDGVLIIDPATRQIVDANPCMTELLGYTRKELLGKELFEIGLFRDQEASRAAFRKLQETGFLRYEDLPLETKTGQRREVEMVSNLYVEAGEKVIQCNIRDITERKRAEETLRKSEERFAQFMRHLPGLAWIKDAEGRYVYANDAVETVFGTRRAELYGKTDQELFPPETAAQFTKNDRQALTSASGIQTIEALAHADRVVHHSIVSKFPVPGPDGKEIMVGGVAFDITEQKEAEEALLDSEERFRLLADTAPVLIWVNGLEGCEFVNREYLQFVGRTMEEVEGMKWATAVHAEDAQSYLSAYLQAFEDRTPFEAQVRLRREDGEYRWMKSAGLPRFATDGRFLGYVGCSLDITDVKQSEEALSEADRRKNEFLAMLAHELRNPLAPIRNALEILRMSQRSDECPVTSDEKEESGDGGAQLSATQGLGDSGSKGVQPVTRHSSLVTCHSSRSHRFHRDDGSSDRPDGAPDRRLA
jgi:PAS domain S-box-containing protein